jgi:hypothetical protein
MEPNPYEPPQVSVEQLPCTAQSAVRHMFLVGLALILGPIAIRVAWAILAGR